jgi:hypothetical protein
MKKWLPALALLGAVLALWFFWRDRSVSGPIAPRKSATAVSPAEKTAGKFHNPDPPPDSSDAVLTPFDTQPASATASAPSRQPAGNPFEPEFNTFPPEVVLEKVGHAIRDYASMFGGNPIGTNPEITAALNGNNPKEARFINAEAGMRINGNGELVDPWGTPYFFHQLSGTEMEIHSAGPDKIMWNQDDLVTK